MWQAREWSILDNWRLMESVWAKRAPHLGYLVDRLPAEESGARDAYRVAYTAFTNRFDKKTEMLPGFLDELVREGDFGRAFAGFWGESETHFYSRFSDDLYRKYRSWLLLFQTGPLFTIIAVLFLFVFLRIQMRNRSKLKRMEQIDQGIAPDDS